MKMAVHHSRHTSKFAQWLEKHEGEPMPRDFYHLQKLSGCSRDTIACYFYRRRSELKRVLKSIPELRNRAVKLRDTFGDDYYTYDLKRYEYIVDKFSLDTKIFAENRKGVTLIFDVPNVYVFREIVNASDLLPESSLPQGKLATDPLDHSTREPFLRNETEYFRATFRDSLRTNPEFLYNLPEKTSAQAESEPDEPDSQNP